MSTDWSEEHASGVDDAAILRAANAWAAAVEVVGQLELAYEAACEAEGDDSYSAQVVRRGALDAAQQQAFELRSDLEYAVIEAYGGPLAKEQAARIRELMGRVQRA